MRMILFLISLLVATPAAGQVVMDARPAATKAEVDAMRQQAPAAADAASQAVKPADLSAAISAIQASIPRARTTTPMQEAVGGAADTAGTYLPGDAQAPRITRAGTVLTSTSNGSWSIAWAVPLAATPVTLPIPVNATSTPVVCNVATSTASGATGRCWYSRALPATLTAVTSLVSYDVFGAPANGISVQVLAIPVTQ